MVSRRAALLIVAAALVSTCSCRSDGDGGIDAAAAVDGSAFDTGEQFDAAADARLPEDAHADAPDAHPVSPEDWRPAFAPRVIYSNPDVVCEPLAMEFAPPARTPAEPGTVRWVYRPATDPAAGTRFAEIGLDDLVFDQHPFLATSAGGMIALVGEDKHHLIVDHEGRFAGARAGDAAPVRMWIRAPDHTLADISRFSRAPSLNIERGAGGTYATMPTEGPGVLPVLPGRRPASIPDPALLPDGTIVWAPTNASLVASCASDGRTRWILEHDPFPFDSHRSVFATAAGDIVLFGRVVYRISPSGSMTASRTVPLPGAPLGWSERCGLAVATTTGTIEGMLAFEGILYVNGTSFDEENHIVRTLGGSLGSGHATSDCGMVEYARVGTDVNLRRLGPDGAMIFDSVIPRRSMTETIELSDGALLIVQLGEPFPPAITILDANGDVELDREFDPAVVGDKFTYAAFIVTPDGVLYTASSRGLGEQQQIVAIEIGRGPATPYPGQTGFHAGMNWARTNAAWH